MDKPTLGDLCRKYGAQLNGMLVGRKTSAEPFLDPVKVLWALCGNESSFGENFTPRHEDGYCRAHVHFDAHASKLWGCWAHCSYGVTQIMFANASGSPIVLATDVDAQLQATVQMLKRPEFKHADLDQIGRLWNGPGESEKYLAELRSNYAMEIPSCGNGS